MPDPLMEWALPGDREPLGARYGLLLDELHADLTAFADAHEPHLEGADWCAPDGSTICDALGNLIFDRVHGAVTRDQVEGWLTDGPPELLDWHADLAGDTPRDTIVHALHFDLAERLLNRENGWPRRA